MTSTPDLLNEDDVRALLNGTPVPHVGVDLDAAMRTGRRMSVRRRAVGVMSGVVAVALAAALVVVVSKPDAPQKQMAAATPSDSSAPASVPGTVDEIRLRCPMTPLAKPVGAAGVQIDPDGTPVRMTAPGTDQVVTSGVTDNGDVVGTYHGKANESYTPAVWRCGSAA